MFPHSHLLEKHKMCMNVKKKNAPLLIKQFLKNRDVSQETY